MLKNLQGQCTTGGNSHYTLKTGTFVTYLSVINIKLFI